MDIKLKFPEGFLWGSATSSYQVEGGIENCDWALEAKNGKVPFCGDACMHYSNYKDDFDIVESLGHNAHRMSVEWARIEPTEGVFDEKEIAHYREVIQNLKSRNLYVSLTIWHFTLPVWFYEKGGFEAGNGADVFTRYALKVIDSFSDIVDDFATINEPMVWTSNGYIHANWPPFKRTIKKHVDILNTLAKAHNNIYKKAKEKNKDLVIGVVKDNIYFEGKNFLTKKIAKFLTWFWNDRFLDKVAGNVDYIGLNYYFHSPILFKSNGDRTDMGWEIYPKGLYHMLMDLKKYNVPVTVAENGIADEGDTRRTEFIREHIRWVHKAIEDGVPVIGYSYWSLLDNYEWALGFKKRFGLVNVDYDTMERGIRNSAYAYKYICEHNGF